MSAQLRVESSGTVTPDDPGATSPVSAPQPAPGESGPPALDIDREVSGFIGGASRPTGHMPPEPPADDGEQQPRRRGRPRKKHSRREQREARRSARGGDRRSAEARSDAARRANETRRQPEAPPEPGPSESDAERLQAAMGFNVAIFTTLRVTFGDEMAVTEQEATACNMALAEYLRAFPGWKPRPEIMLGLVYLGVFGPKLARPTVQERMGSIWRWAKHTGARLFGSSWFKRKGASHGA